MGLRQFSLDRNMNMDGMQFPPERLDPVCKQALIENRPLSQSAFGNGQFLFMVELD